jgi:Domain of unknown function (DUF5615)
MVVIDEGVPRQLVARLREHGIDAHGFDRRWRGASNGELLALVEAAGYTVLVTNDKNLFHQQNFRGRKLAVVALPTNRKVVVMQRASDVADTIARVRPGQHVAIEPTGERIVRQEVEGAISEASLPAVDPFVP